MIHIFLGSQNACARFMLCCLKCCFWCLEHFIKFINRNAYIMVSYIHQCSLFVLWQVSVNVNGLVNTCTLFCPTDSNIWKELLHFFQGRFLPLDEECGSVRPWLNVFATC